MKSLLHLSLGVFLLALLPFLQAANNGGVVVHLFEWRFEDVAKECEQVLGPAGYSAVQVSPIQDHVFLGSQGYPWWQRYQPVSYYINSRSGNQNDFVNMVQRCNAVGVAIFVDVVFNHLCSVCTQASTLVYPDVPYSSLDFHTGSCSIDYQNAWSVRNCPLSGLPDLDQSKPYVQDKIAGFMNTLISLGVKGFRLDAAKHVEQDQVAAIVAKVNNLPDGTRPYIYQEIIDLGSEAVKANWYYASGDIIDFKYMYQMADKFTGLAGGKPSMLQYLGNSGEIFPAVNTLVCVDNHDFMRIGHGGFPGVLSHPRRGRYSQANAFMLAFPGGRPQIASSYYWQRNIQTVDGKLVDQNSGMGPPSLAFGVTKNADCNWTLTQNWNNWNDDPNFATWWPEWNCEHRWPAMKAMVGFYNYVGDSPVNNWWSSSNGWAIGFGRGNKAYVVINSDISNAVATYITTGLPAGTYCDIITGSLYANKTGCTGRSVTVNADSTAYFSIGTSSALSVIAIHTGQKTSDIRRTVVFIKQQTVSGQDMFVRGGLDHTFSGCTAPPCQQNGDLANCKCAMPITQNNLRNTGTTTGWKTGDNFLDWYGIEPTQGSGAWGTALEWTTNIYTAGGATVDVQGYGYTPLNQWGPHYWMMDVQMDCSKTYNGWFEVKSYVTNGVGWEANIAQGGTPYSSGNHFAKCGMISKFEAGTAANTLFLNFP